MWVPPRRTRRPLHLSFSSACAPSMQTAQVAPNSPCALGPSPCALGPHPTATSDAQHLCTKSFASATIYYPTSDGLPLLPSICIVPGWGCGEQNQAAWGPFYASHGIVAMIISTPAPFRDAPAARSRALLDASLALQSEHEREGSVLKGRLDVERRAVQGYSLGGGAAQIAALNDQTLKCVIAVCPDDGKRFGADSWVEPGTNTLSFPSEPPRSVPVLIISGEKDTEAPVKVNAWPHYRQTAATKLIFEVAGGDHFVANGPAGGRAVEDPLGLSTTNFMIGLCCIVCGCPNACMFGGPCPCGTLNEATGHATPSAPRGAVGGVALAWLRLFLKDDESARAQLVIRPDIASAFECSGVEAPLAMER